ncbi:OmpA/MotB family protein [Nocardioides yefusunii]|uniref:Flagellar motor protein MotB n=1 Tax=Nocardioides yefusunii TaxID=2500546 RepID=A0ABW1QXC1_9ACTN|nr:flagellar motor protein MotB [Nocardioides yefusunii]
MARRKKREIEEEHENHERWMVTYADMVTLLMVLFIVMFAMGQTDKDRFDQLKAGLSAGFGQESVIRGGSSTLSSSGSTAIDAAAPGSGDSLDAAQQEAVTREVERQALLRTQRTHAEAEAEVTRLLAIRDDVRKRLEIEGLGEDVVTTIDRRGLVISLVSRHVVFEAHSAELTGRGAKVVRTLAKVLRPIPDDLEIDGHTNQVKVQPKYYATDWDLSSARAVTVLRYLQEDLGFKGERLTAAAFGHEKPLIDPKKAGSQRINKRVDIVVLSSSAAEIRAQLEQVAKERGEN